MLLDLLAPTGRWQKHNTVLQYCTEQEANTIAMQVVLSINNQNINASNGSKTMF